MSAPIKTSYDRTILTMAAEGAVSGEIVAATGKTFNQIYSRAMHLGVWPLMVRNRRDRRLAREDRRRVKAKTRGYHGSLFAAALISPTRVDHAASDIARTLRAAARRVRADVPVPAGAIAHAFYAGLTLDDIDAAFNVPAIEAVAAIRQHFEIRL